MLKFLVVSFFLVTCLGQKIADQKCKEYAALAKADSDSPQCKVFEDKKSEVQVEPNEFRASALLGYVKENSTTVKYICDAVIISPDTLLAAGHCLRSIKDKPKWARVGATYSTLGLEVEVKSSECHPDYNPGNDIAVVKLKDNLNSSFIPACLDTQGVSLEESVVGVGQPIAKIYLELRSKSPIRSQLNLKPQKSCVQEFPKQNVSSESTLCVKDPLNGPGDCLSGPLYMSRERCVHTVVGVASFGKICLSETPVDRSPSVYTKVNHYISWIEQMTWPTDSSLNPQNSV